MHVQDMIFVSVDDHVVEPPDLFEGRLPAAYADTAPRVERTAEGDDVWVFDAYRWSRATTATSTCPAPWTVSRPWSRRASPTSGPISGSSTTSGPPPSA